MHGPIWCIQHWVLQKSRGIWKGASTTFMYRKGEQRLGEGNTCQTTGSPCSKTNKFLFFWEKQRSLSTEVATLTHGTHRGAGRVIAPPRREQPIFSPLLFATSCILGLLLMQAGARHYQWLSGKLADNDFSSKNKADIFQFSVWTKRRKHFIWRERQLSWGISPVGLSWHRSAVRFIWCQHFVLRVIWEHPASAPLCGTWSFTCGDSPVLPPAASPNLWNCMTRPTESGSSKPSWGKLRPPTPLKGC